MTTTANGKHIPSFKYIFKLKLLLLFQGENEREGASL